LNKIMMNWWDLIVAGILLVGCLLFTVRDHNEEDPVATRQYAMAETGRYCRATAAQDWHSEFVRRFAEQRCMHDILEVAPGLQRAFD